MINPSEQIDNSKLLRLFNVREEKGFEDIYKLYTKSLNIFAASLYGSVCDVSQDAVEDAFISLWMSKSTFDSLPKLKSYLYVSIKNTYLGYIKHNTQIKKYESQLRDSDFMVEIVESEIYSVMDTIRGILPEHYFEVIKKYIEGYKPSEIAEMLGKTEQSIYNMKHEAVKIIKKKIKGDKLLSIILLLLS